MPPELQSLADDRLIPAIEVQRRYGVSHMTLYRWQKRTDLGFPAAVMIAGRRYWYLGALVEWERRQAARTAA